MSSKFLTSLRYLVLVFCILLLTLPYASVYYPGEYESEWVYAFVFEEILFLIPGLLLTGGWLLYFRELPATNRRILLAGLLLLLSFLFMMFALATIVGFTLDYIPAVGTIIMLLLFPTMVGYFLLQYRVSKRA